VLTVPVVRSDGVVLDLLRSLRKDNTGLPLAKLFVGAEGTLGVITKAAIQLAPAPKVSPAPVTFTTLQAVNVAFLSCKTFADVVNVFRSARNSLGEILSGNLFPLLPLTGPSVRISRQRIHDRDAVAAVARGAQPRGGQPLLRARRDAR
jgi:FAD/FMN-containing dehydrogenase